MENLVEKLWKACGKADGNVNNCKHLLVLAFLTNFWVRAFFCYAGYSNVSPWVMGLWPSAFGHQLLNGWWLASHNLATMHIYSD